MTGLWMMFWVFCKASITTFGGGFAMIPLISQELVLHAGGGWFSPEQVKDIIALSVMTPGAFGSSAAAFSGMMAFGPFGAALCAGGVVLPSAALSVLIARWFYAFKNSALVRGALSGVKPVVVGLIAAAAIKMALENLFMLNYKTVVDLNAVWAFLRSLDWRAVLIFAGALFCLVKLKADPVLVILGSGALGLILYLLIPAII
jgi:chromate transporter